ncbi:ABC transporter substrate-binding protein [Solicola sp. PLA-1-18]|uniref:ABC transporter substrate-binding protein n=1 Tax=Solicola sp. PLA-1-18 TaxID=3380532 RepID=UPI003B7EC262
MSHRHLRRSVMLAVAGALSAATLVACGGGSSDSAAPDGADAEAQCKELADADSGDAGEDTFVFAASSDPTTLNPFHASDGETFRVSRQIFEGLVSAKPCTADPAPSLATKWETSEDGKSTTFTLRDGVTFQDGTPFNGAAVCSMFEYWNNQPAGPAQTEDVTYYWISLFKGFGDKSIYDSCATEGNTATITLKQPYAGFVASMSLPAFSMQSPTALAKYNKVEAGGDPTSSEYGTAHPTGTGPYSFVSWDRGQAVTLKANESYWGDKAKTPNVRITTIADGKARTDALRAGDIDGFDLVGPGDIKPLQDEDFELVQRPAFNVLYLGFNQKIPALADPKVRQAIAHAIDKDAIVSQSMTPGSVAAKEFIPEVVNGYNDDVTGYDYDPAKAKALLKEAGQENLELTFNYPTDVSRPYMPSPQDTFNVIRGQLQEVGIKVTPVADQWSPDYLDKIQGGQDHGIHLLGWTGDYNDTDNFLGVFFGQASNEWGFTNQTLFDELAAARQLPTVEEQKPAYEKINADVMDYLPGVPLAHGVPSLAFGPGVKGFVPSPVQDESFANVTVTK